MSADARTAWCPDCHARRTVTDEFPDSILDVRGEVGVWVTRLDCGHATHREGAVVNPDPTLGAAAPYAGPHHAVASTTRGRDLAAADTRQRAITPDPWAPRGDE